LYNRRLVSAISLILIVSLVVTATPTTSRPQPTSATFVLSGWDYDDGYGQGIEVVYVHENSTGSWVKIKDPAYFLPSDETTVEINGTENTALRFQIGANINHTLHGLSDNTTAYIIMRVGIEISTPFGVIYSNTSLNPSGTVFDDSPTTWSIFFDVYPNFLLNIGWIYSVNIEYDIYQLDETGESQVLTATSGTTDAQTPNGDYTDTHEQDLVFFGGTDPTDMSVDLWVEFSDPISEFNYSVYWNSASGGEIHIYDHDASDWVILDGSPNGDGGPIAWDNDTVSNEDYYNETHVGFRLYCGIVDGAAINVDYYHIHTSPGYHWVDINELNLYFPISYSSEQVFLGNFAFILLGLVMVPASTIYLVYGGRDKLTQDKFFYFLIAFIIGWAFIIGGVMP